MAAINYGVMKRRVALSANNLSSSDPRYTEYLTNADGLTVVNEAADRLILHAVASDRRAVNCFPELKDRGWSDVNTAGQNFMQLPNNLLVLDSATCTRTTTAYDPATQREYLITESPDPDSFGFMSRTATGWPTLWRRAGKRFEYWPTTTTAYRTYIVLRGIRRESTLTEDTDTFEMGDIWHPTIIKCATAILMDYMGLPDAANWWEAVDRDVTATINLLGLEQLNDDVQWKISGVPT